MLRKLWAAFLSWAEGAVQDSEARMRHSVDK
ncbi:MAG: hypothetical protein QOF36_2521 [Microbacteriaceae bacterium]|jgi:hypothetical protein|nr:hypothetical protein [Microbacteriaceae bacterium]